MNQQNKNKPKISLLLCTKNEESNLKKHFDWLDSCKSINEIIAIDDNSTDDTKKIINGFASPKRNVKIFERGLDQNFSAQRKFGISNAKNDWVLWLDADEKPSDKMIRFLNHIDLCQYNSFSFKRNDVFLKKELKHGETANLRFVRLFNKNNGRFKGAVHEVWKTKKGTIVKDLVIYHYSHQTLKSFIQKINFYTDIRAKELFEQKIPVSLFDIIIYPTAKFFQNYFIKLGFLDSTPGIIMALCMSLHSFLVRAKLWHLYQENQTG